MAYRLLMINEEQWQFKVGRVYVYIRTPSGRSAIVHSEFVMSEDFHDIGAVKPEALREFIVAHRDRLLLGGRFDG